MKLEIVFLRHGITSWNLEKRIQGHTDIPLSRQGREALAHLTVPRQWRSWPWFTSPLRRARETACILGLDAQVEELLIEMHYGSWEGRILEELDETELRERKRQELRGLDMQPPRGESPRQVQRRLRTWAQRLVARGIRQAGAVSHKGVIRAVLADACGWDMVGDPPYKLDYSRPQRFGWDGCHWSPVHIEVKRGRVLCFARQEPK